MTCNYRSLPALALLTALLLGSALCATGQNAPAGGGAAKTRATDEKSKQEVDALIEKLGRTPPDWYAKTPLDYPKTLDLSWPERPQPPWNAQKNVGQYVWDIINPNPARWPEGIKLMHHLLTVHKDDKATQERAMLSLARMYHDLLEDYARAAFWYRKVGAEDVNEYPSSAINLAECYWRLGSKSMAMELLNKIDPPRFYMIKLLGDMGETDRALEIAQTYFKDAQPQEAILAAADACRLAGRQQEAIDFYQKLIDVTPPSMPGRPKKCRDRAVASLDAIRLFELSDVRKVPDGAYRASSLGYEAQIEIEVAVKNKRIESVKVTQHKEKQFYSALSDTPRKIIEKQSVRGVDATSSATITSEAIINATAKALSAAAGKQ